MTPNAKVFIIDVSSIGHGSGPIDARTAVPGSGSALLNSLGVNPRNAWLSDIAVVGGGGLLFASTALGTILSWRIDDLLPYQYRGRYAIEPLHGLPHDAPQRDWEANVQSLVPQCHSLAVTADGRVCSGWERGNVVIW